VQQKTGAQYTDVWFGLKQQQNYYSLLQNQVRFAGTRSAPATSTSRRGTGCCPSSYNAILDSDVFFLTLSDFVKVTGSYKAPTWMSSIQGANQGSIWASGTTAFADALGFALQIGVRRRNSHGAATALTALAVLRGNPRVYGCRSRPRARSRPRRETTPHPPHLPSLRSRRRPT
jgi:hypothetical protein